MLFTSAVLNLVSTKGYAVVESSSLEDTRKACELLGRVMLRTQVTPRENPKGTLATDREMELHTDHPRAMWISWHCVRQSSVGGVSLLKDARRALAQLDHRSLQELRQICLSTHRVFVGDNPEYPVLRDAHGQRDWLYYTPWMKGASASEAFAVFEKILNSEDTIDVRLKPGNVLLIDNTRMLHGRSRIEGDKSRLLERIWIGHPSDNFVPLAGLEAQPSGQDGKPTIKPA